MCNNDKVKKQAFDGKPVVEASSVVSSEGVALVVDEALAVLGTTRFHSIQLIQQSEAGTEPQATFVARLTDQCSVELQRLARVADTDAGGLRMPLVCQTSSVPTFDLKGVNGQKLAAAVAAGTALAGGSAKAVEVTAGADGRLVIQILGSQAPGKARVDLEGKPVK